MTLRPGSITPQSLPDSGVGTVGVSESNHPSVVAEEVADEITVGMFDNVLSGDLDTRNIGQLQERIKALSDAQDQLKLQNEQLEAQLASARSEKDEVESRHRAAQEANEGHVQRARSLDGQLEEAKKQLASSDGFKTQLERDLVVARSAQSRELTASQVVQAAGSGREQELEVERNVLREHVGRLENQSNDLQNQVTGLQARHAEAQAIIAEQSDAAMRNQVSKEHPTIDLQGDSSEEKPLLAAAYQQISVLNTQLAHLYTELTMARTEVQRLRSEQSAIGRSRGGPGGDSEAEVMKQSQQIADLVSDIRHLQLDLEYHQQKLDQMIEEKQLMMRDLKKSQGEVEEGRRQLEERDQMLKHRDVDLKQLKEEMRSPRPGQMPGEFEGDGALAALRGEAAAKDSALIVSHYELHKEKLLRDRLEQKNLKLMERMQKLMMVVETMRKENVTLERSLFLREQTCETKEQQLRQVTQKAKQLQKLNKVAKSGNKGGSKTVLELASPSQQGLPPLDRSSRSIDSGGRRSGASTPRTPRAPPSPYGTR